MLLDIPNFAEALLSFLYDSLDCTLFGRPKDAKIALCEPTDPCCDYLAVYLDDIPGVPQTVNCETLDDTAMVSFRIKLVRPMSLQNACTPTKQDLDKVRSSMVDGVALRQAILRFATEHIAELLCVDPCFVAFEIAPVLTICQDNGEKCSGWLTGLTVDMSLCDDGPCAIPLEEVSGRFCVPGDSLLLGMSGDNVVSYE